GDELLGRGGRRLMGGGGGHGGSLGEGRSYPARASIRPWFTSYPLNVEQVLRHARGASERSCRREGLRREPPERGGGGGAEARGHVIDGPRTRLDRPLGDAALERGQRALEIGGRRPDAGRRARGEGLQRCRDRTVYLLRSRPYRLRQAGIAPAARQHEQQHE